MGEYFTHDKTRVGIMELIEDINKDIEYYSNRKNDFISEEGNKNTESQMFILYSSKEETLKSFKMKLNNILVRG